MTDLGGLLTLLVDAGVELVVVGGVAATAHGATRLTQDIDVVYARDGGNLERLARSARTIRTSGVRLRVSRSSSMCGAVAVTSDRCVFTRMGANGGVVWSWVAMVRARLEAEAL